MPDYSYHDIAKMIDHSLLKPGMMDSELEAGIDLALDYDVASVCIQPHYLARLAKRLEGSTIKTSTVIGFPHGGHTSEMKIAEAKEAIQNGCQELDLVVNTGKVRSGEWSYVAAEVAGMTEVAHQAGQTVKVIFENALLTEEEKIRLCQICNEVRADWAKTSTGFAASGATVDDIKLMRKHCAAQVQIKAAGGVRDLETVLVMRQLGASRCGASLTKEILNELKGQLA